MGDSRWLAMCVAAGALYASCKALSWWTTPSAGVPGWRQLAYLLAWPGMDARTFLQPQRTTIFPAPAEWLRGVRNLTLGGLLVFAVAPAIDSGDDLLVGWIGVTGLVLMFHFGALHLASCVWRQCGFDAPPLMNRPFSSTSLSEFWGRRWNTAFRDLNHRYVFLPLTATLGTRAAAFAGFVASGLVHDFVISVPAGGGYGLPTLYFVLQGCAVRLERSEVGRRFRLGEGRRGRLFTAFTVLAPVSLLFHRPFVTTVIVPLMRAMGALS